MDTTKKLTRFLAIGLFAVFMNASVSHAAVYTYTGNNFDTFFNSTAYSGAAKITGFFELANPLAANLSLQSIIGDITSFSFSDAVIPEPPFGAVPTKIINTFQVSTDQFGNISNWFIDITSVYDGDPIDTVVPGTAGVEVLNTGIASKNITVGGGPFTVGADDFASFNNCTAAFSIAGPCAQGVFGDSGAISESAGSWEVTEVSLPPTFPLFTAGLGLLGLLRWRRKLA
jgi:hypothetical protein